MTPFHTANLRVEPQGADSAILWVNLAGRPFNVFNQELLVDFNSALDHVAAQADIRLLFISSSKPSGFFAGADLDELASIATSEQAAP